jgi:hypothetical protein
MPVKMSMRRGLRPSIQTRSGSVSSRSLGANERRQRTKSEFSESGAEPSCVFRGWLDEVFRETWFRVNRYRVR